VNPDGNERLTAAVGVLVLIPVLVEVATVLFGVHTFMSWHVFVGLALIPVVVLKLLSTGWRFVRYYMRSHPYVVHGPPQTATRLLAPLFVVATVVLFGSGVAMGFLVLGGALVSVQHRWVHLPRGPPRPERRSVQCAEGAVLAGAEPAAAVLDHRQRHPHRGGLDAANRAAVRDHEHAFIARMAFGDPP
jgi:hypothetical protein